MYETDYPGIKGLLIKDFIKQIDYICKNYSVIKLEDYTGLIKAKKAVPNNACILTFDDGFKDHYTNVFPILKKKKLPATFFPLTQPLSEFVVPAVHKTHFLLAKLGAPRFAEEINSAMEKKFSEFSAEYFIDDKIKKAKRYKWDDNLSANLKWTISAMPVEIKNKVLNFIFSKYFEDEKEFCKNLYMSFDQMREMIEGGMSFGSHSVTHPALSKLSSEEQDKEIRNSKITLEKELGVKISAFSYPYGDFNEATIDILKKEGFLCAVTTNAGLNKENDANLFTLDRLDTNDLCKINEK
jgi:peptidoglycan/xylan/chitin deacetylase (PgdA/CDA1 family)